MVQAGLQPGEKVVLNGQIGVMPGAKVNVVNGASDAQQPAGKAAGQS